jgi:hypothetical protein
MVIPAPRNSDDAVLPQFQGGKSPVGSTPCTCANAKECDMGIRSEGGGGQPCLWWSQGCSIGCDYCATDPRHPANHGQIPTTSIDGGWPHSDKAGFRTAYCDEPGQDVLPKQFWTMNLAAVPGAVNDSCTHPGNPNSSCTSTLPPLELPSCRCLSCHHVLCTDRFNPWRAPGTAPVVDPCGQAGGKFPQTKVGGDSVFYTTPLAKMGDMVRGRFASSSAARCLQRNAND